MKNNILFGVFAAGAIVACLVFAGCFRKAEEPTGQGAGKPAATATASESSAKSVPARSAGTGTGAGAGVGSFLREIGSAPASDLLAGYFKPYPLVGLGLIVLGALSFIFGGKGNGIILVAMGFVTGMAGASVVQYPFVSLMVPLAVGALLVYAIWQLTKAKKAAAVVVDAVENAENKAEITAGIREHGPEAVQLVRWLVDPIKTGLAKVEAKEGEAKIVDG